MDGSTVPKGVATGHPQTPAAKAKPDPQNLADLRPAIGRLVERALVLAGVSKQEAAYRMHYSDAGTVSRWCNGIERPLFDKLFTIAGFQAAYVQAIAEQHPDFEVTTEIKIRRVA